MLDCIGYMGVAIMDKYLINHYGETVCIINDCEFETDVDWTENITIMDITFNMTAVDLTNRRVLYCEP